MLNLTSRPFQSVSVPAFSTMYGSYFPVALHDLVIFVFKTGHIRKYVAETLSNEPHLYPREAFVLFCLRVYLFNDLVGLLVKSGSPTV